MNTKKLDLSVLAWFATLAVVLVILFGLAGMREGNREWMVTQRDYADIMLARHEKAALEAKAAGKPVPALGDTDKIAIRQLMLTDLKRVDRCTTCHLAIDDKSFEGEKQPFAAHPDMDMIAINHPTDKFGCTSCHGGQGMGTTSEAAHGFVHKWDYPMLGDRKAMTKYVQASCAQCHTDSTKWAAIGAPKLARGKQIFGEKNCISCHKLGEEGGNIGPELTFEGDKVPEQFGFEHLKANLEAGTLGEEAKAEAKHLHHDIETWHKFHFKNPQAVSSGSIMPAFGFSDEDTEALVTYMLSLKATTVPASMMTNDAKVNAKAIPAAKKAAAAAPAAAAVAAAPAGAKADGTKVYETNCASCHQATGAGMPGVFPPLAGAEIPNGDAAEHIKIVLHGKSGPMTVLGKQYNGAMPPFAQLTDEEIAAVVTHERTSWGNKGSAVTPAQVKALR
ncbi:MAG TPA: c-type cytochrome [Pantanalinema sp.]